MGSALIYLIQPFIYHIYIKNNYTINILNSDGDSNLLEQRWDRLAINIFAFIHNNTDVVIFVIAGNFCMMCQVYSSLFSCGSRLKSIIVAISQAILPIVGRTYAKWK